MIRHGICVFIAVFAGLTSAEAQQRQAARGNQASGNAFEIARVGAWSVLTTGEGRSKSCFIMTQPAERLPKGLTRDPAHVYITIDRKSVV